jgi:hypothetical protein
VKTLARLAMPARLLATTLSLVVAACSVSTPCAAQLQNFGVEILNGPAAAGNSQTLRITARTFLNLAIPLYDPQSDITITVTGATVTYSNPSGGFPLSSDGVVSSAGITTFDANGQFTCAMTCSLAGTYSLSVSDGTATGSGSVTWTPGAAHHLSFSTQPANLALGDPLTPVIVILDSFGNTVSNDARTITLALVPHDSGATLGGTTSINAVLGVATWQQSHELQVSKGGAGFVLRAGHNGAAFAGSDTVDSEPFDVVDPNSNSNTNSNTNSNGNNNDNSSGGGGQNTNNNGGTTPGGTPDDSDGDGTPDALDAAPNDADANGNGIPDGEEVDSDSDGLVDAHDPNPSNPDTDGDGRLDGADNCPTFANGDQTDTDGNGVGDSCEDDDRDGVINGIEASGPNNGDGNQDGRPDSQQSNVATFEDTANGFVTLVAPDGTRLSKVRSLVNPSPNDSPAIGFPVGFFGYTLAGLPTAGVTTQLQLIFNWQDGTTVDNFYNFGPTPEDGKPHWYQFMEDGDSGAEIQGNIITLKLIDGGRGDDDLSANGEVSKVGGPALGWVPESSVCGGAACGPAGVGMIALTFAGILGLKYIRRRTKSRSIRRCNRSCKKQ